MRESPMTVGTATTAIIPYVPVVRGGVAASRRPTCPRKPLYYELGHVDMFRLSLRLEA